MTSITGHFYERQRMILDIRYSEGRPEHGAAVKRLADHLFACAICQGTDKALEESEARSAE